MEGLHDTVSTAVNASDMVLEPTISFSVPDSASYVTLAMVDPDAPVSVSSTYEPFGHFLVGNIPLPTASSPSRGSQARRSRGTSTP